MRAGTHPLNIPSIPCTTAENLNPTMAADMVKHQGVTVENGTETTSTFRSWFIIYKISAG